MFSSTTYFHNILVLTIHFHYPFIHSFMMWTVSQTLHEHCTWASTVWFLGQAREVELAAFWIGDSTNNLLFLLQGLDGSLSGRSCPPWLEFEFALICVLQKQSLQQQLWEEDKPVFWLGLKSQELCLITWYTGTGKHRLTNSVQDTALNIVHCGQLPHFHVHSSSHNEHLKVTV